MELKTREGTALRARSFAWPLAMHPQILKLWYPGSWQRCKTAGSQVAGIVCVTLGRHSDDTQAITTHFVVNINDSKPLFDPLEIEEDSLAASVRAGSRKVTQRTPEADMLMEALKRGGWLVFVAGDLPESVLELLNVRQNGGHADEDDPLKKWEEPKVSPEYEAFADRVRESLHRQRAEFCPKCGVLSFVPYDMVSGGSRCYSCGFEG